MVVSEVLWFSAKKKIAMTWLTWMIYETFIRKVTGFWPTACMCFSPTAVER